MARRCSRPLCEKDSEVVLLFVYDERHVVLDWAPSDHDPNHLELCLGHADRFNPPRGWSVEDARSSPGSLYIPGRNLVPTPIVLGGHLPRADLPRTVAPPARQMLSP